MMKQSKALQKLLTILVVILGTGIVNARNSLPDFTRLVEKNSPAVVNISTVVQSKHQDSRSGSPQDDDFQDYFFRHFFGDQLPPRQPRSAVGSGFIISEDGYILTNHHVVANADEVLVRLKDRREFRAEIIGTDARSDIALMKVEADDLPTVTISKSGRLKVGEWVLAIGSPFGFNASVTAGIVSAKGRCLANENSTNYVPFIQTDVAINPGNSGGPLFNLKGEVVGINSQIYTRSGGFMGLSFSIPSDVVIDVVAQLKAKGKVSRGFLGVTIQEVSSDLVEAFGLDRPSGALVSEVLEDSPADLAGIEVEDVIIEFDGKRINESCDLPHIVGRTKVGEEVNAVVIRDNKREKITIEVGELPSDGNDENGSNQYGSRGNRLGLMVDEVDDELKDQWSVPNGVIIMQLKSGPGRDAGLKRGDVIVSINHEKIKSVDHFNQVVKNLPANKKLPILIIRQGNRRFLPLKIDE